jgi:hypothetical protein
MNLRIFRYIFLFLLVFSASSILNAQTKKNLIKTSLIMPLAETFEISYERGLTNDISLHFGAGFGEIMFFNPQFRYFLSENTPAPAGSFIAPYALIAGEDPGVGGGVLVGHQRLFKDKISLEAYLGPLITGEGVALWGGINFGIAF